MKGQPRQTLYFGLENPDIQMSGETEVSLSMLDPHSALKLAGSVGCSQPQTLLGGSPGTRDGPSGLAAA
jgi:hypothetical protein